MLLLADYTVIHCGSICALVEPIKYTLMGVGSRRSSAPKVNVMYRNCYKLKVNILKNTHTYDK